jgi:urocanate hydratase
LAPDLPESSEPASFSLTVYKLYRALTQTQETVSDQVRGEDPSLGGRFFWVGELDAVGCALVVAANIAGAASLTASRYPVAQRQAIRDGVIDFLVTSLDEALRIIKNEIRKRETVAVCVAAAPSDVLREMEQRGVRPDVLRDAVTEAGRRLETARGTDQESDKSEVLLVWSVESAPAQELPKLDALVTECLDPKDSIAHRWLRFATRYLGRLSQNTRVLAADRALAEQIIARIRRQTASGEIKVRSRLELRSATRTEEFVFGPSAVGDA